VPIQEEQVSFLPPVRITVSCVCISWAETTQYYRGIMKEGYKLHQVDFRSSLLPPAALLM